MTPIITGISKLTHYRKIHVFVVLLCLASGSSYGQISIEGMEGDIEIIEGSLSIAFTSGDYGPVYVCNAQTLLHLIKSSNQSINKTRLMKLSYLELPRFSGQVWT